MYRMITRSIDLNQVLKKKRKENNVLNCFVLYFPFFWFCIFVLYFCVLYFYAWYNIFVLYQLFLLTCFLFCVALFPCYTWLLCICFCCVCSCWIYCVFFEIVFLQLVLKLSFINFFFFSFLKLFRIYLNFTIFVVLACCINALYEIRVVLEHVVRDVSEFCIN